MTAFPHLLYVPTNRPCMDQIDDLAKEGAVIKDMAGDCLVAIIEHGELQWTEAHRAALRAAREKFGVEVALMDWAGTEAFLKAALDDLPLDPSARQRLFDLLHPKKTAYGAGPNKAALLAAAAQTQVLHRRDSDVRLANRADIGTVYPCVLELGAIGRSVSDLGLEGEASGSLTTDKVSFVGTDIFGSGAHDRRDLMAIDPRHAVAIERLAAPDSTEESLMADINQYMVEAPNIRHDRDFYEEDTKAKTCIGISAVADIFKVVPEMPIQSTLGSDYLGRNAFRFLGKPIIYHSRKMEHQYDTARAKQTDLDAVVDYARRDLRHMIIWPILVTHHQTLKKNPQAYMDPAGNLDMAAYTDCLAAALEASRPIMATMPEGFAAIYQEAANESEDPARRDRLLAVAEGVRYGPDYVQEVVQGIEDFIFLIRQWPSLLAAAQRQSAASLIVA